MKKNLILLSALTVLLGIGQVSAQTKKTSSKSGKSSGKSSSGGGGGSAGYTTGIGLRGASVSSGLTIKHFFNPGKGAAVEGLVTTEYQGRGVRFTLLMEKHWLLLPEIKNLQWYVGGGLHAGAYRGRYYYAVAYRRKHYDRYYVYYVDDKVYPVFGADLVLGLEYKIPDLPLVIGADYKPYFDVYDGANAFYHDAALSVRFSF